jgi:hypothetical protein
VAPLSCRPGVGGDARDQGVEFALRTGDANVRAEAHLGRQMRRGVEDQLDPRRIGHFGHHRALGDEAAGADLNIGHDA